uniref:Uncharacterized protein n=1 Tax=Brassica oleracea TaxID=3712 RepID=A0A3P6D0E9_BRAOL|nr:unnamed protein product [Brassica oleracea]
MSHLVRLVVGDWERGGQRTWRFNVDQMEVKHDIVVRENEMYNALLGMVRTNYKLDQILLPCELVILTYSFPDFSDDPIGYTLPPVELKEDGDVELFMSVRLDCPWLDLYVTFGDRDVDGYRHQRREEDGITMGMVARTEITITELEGINL